MTTCQMLHIRGPSIQLALENVLNVILANNYLAKTWGPSFASYEGKPSEFLKRA